MSIPTDIRPQIDELPSAVINELAILEDRAIRGEERAEHAEASLRDARQTIESLYATVDQLMETHRRVRELLDTGEQQAIVAQARSAP